MKILSKTVFPGDYVLYPNTLGLYVTVPMLGTSKLIFDAQFIHLTRYALSTGHTSEFTAVQLEFFTEWLEYQVALMNGVTTHSPDSPINAFDDELVNISECRNTTDQVIDGNSTLHVYNPCPVN